MPLASTCNIFDVAGRSTYLYVYTHSYTEGWKPFAPMPGRRSAKYLVVPAAVRNSPASLMPWLKSARAFAASLPPKKKR